MCVCVCERSVIKQCGFKEIQFPSNVVCCREPTGSWRVPPAPGRPCACCVPPWPGGSTSGMSRVPRRSPRLLVTPSWGTRTCRPGARPRLKSQLVLYRVPCFSPRNHRSGSPERTNLVSEEEEEVLIWSSMILAAWRMVLDSFRVFVSGSG